MNIRPEYWKKHREGLNDDEKKYGEAVRRRYTYTLAQTTIRDTETPRRLMDESQYQAMKWALQGKAKEFYDHWMGIEIDDEAAGS